MRSFFLTLLFLLVLPACSTSSRSEQENAAALSLKEAIQKHVGDKDRQQQLLDTAEQLQHLLAGYQKSFSVFKDELQAQNRQYQATTETLEPMLTDFSRQRRATWDEFTRLHFKLLELTTEQEWRRIHRAELKLLKEGS